MLDKVQRFFPGKTELCRADFVHLAAGAQARDGQHRIDPGGDDQVHLLGLVVDQVANRLVDCQLADELVIVQHQDKIPRHGLDVVDQRDHQAFNRGRLGQIQRCQGILAQVWLDLL